MRRRRLLKATTAGLTLPLAGCLAVDVLSPRTDDGRHPLADTTLTVRIDNQSDTDHDVRQNAREALDFWEEHSQKYVGFDVAFEIVEADDSDIILAYADTPAGCDNVENYSEGVLGCAPLIRPGQRPRRPITARIVAGVRPFGKIRITTKHEVGHILGLDHDDEPREIMSNRPEDRIPLYDVRREIWETVGEVQQRGRDATRAFERGIERWNDETYEESARRFRTASEEFAKAHELARQAYGRTAEFEDHQHVETVDLERLRTHLDRLTRRMRAAESFTKTMADAADAAGRGDPEEANELLSRANDGIREFNKVGSPTMQDVAIALGLVRGFDRDEDVVDIGEEGVRGR